MVYHRVVWFMVPMLVRNLLLLVIVFLLMECRSIEDNTPFIKGDVTCSEYNEYSSSDTNCIVIYNHTRSALYGNAPGGCFTLYQDSYHYIGSVALTNSVALSTSSDRNNLMILKLNENQGVGVHELDSSTQEPVDSTPISDTTSPSGSVQINNGASSTKSRSVALNLCAFDVHGVTGYYVSTSSATPAAGASGWQSVSSTVNFSTNVSHTLSSGTGTKTVYSWFKDATGKVSSSTSDNIYYNPISTEIETGQGSTTGGIVYLYFSIPIETSSVRMTVKLAGDFGASYEYATVYFNGNYLGTVSSGTDGYTLVTPSGWSSKSISSSYWTAGSTARVNFYATDYVNYNPGGGYYYKYQVKLTYQ